MCVCVCVVVDVSCKPASPVGYTRASTASSLVCMQVPYAKVDYLHDPVDMQSCS